MDVWVATLPFIPGRPRRRVRGFNGRLIKKALIHSRLLPLVPDYWLEKINDLGSLGLQDLLDDRG